MLFFINQYKKNADFNPTFFFINHFAVTMLIYKIIHLLVALKFKVFLIYPTITNLNMIKYFIFIKINFCC